MAGQKNKHFKNIPGIISDKLKRWGIEVDEIIPGAIRTMLIIKLWEIVKLLFW